MLLNAGFRLALNPTAYIDDTFAVNETEERFLDFDVN